MASAKISNNATYRGIAAAILLLFTLLTSTLSAQTATEGEPVFGRPAYRLSDEENLLSMQFSQSWSFDNVDLPSVAQDLWGENNQCRAAVIKIDNKSFISRLSDDENRLYFNLHGATTSQWQIIPVFTVNTKRSPGESPVFVATPARIRKLEDELKELADSVLRFQQRNSCFSCHTALPLAITCKVAAASGMRIPSTSLNQIGRDRKSVV